MWSGGAGVSGTARRLGQAACETRLNLPGGAIAPPVFCDYVLPCKTTRQRTTQAQLRSQLSSIYQLHHCLIPLLQLGLLGKLSAAGCTFRRQQVTQPDKEAAIVRKAAN